MVRHYSYIIRSNTAFFFVLIGFTLIVPLLMYVLGKDDGREDALKECGMGDRGIVVTECVDNDCTEGRVTQ